MMKKTVLVCLLALFVTNSAWSQNELDSEGKKQGKWSKDYPWGVTRYTGQFKDDLEIGTFRFFDKNGKLVSERTYLSPGGKAEVRMYNMNEVLHASGMMIGKKRLGEWLFFGKNEKVVSKEFYVDGKKDGEEVSYYANGNVAERMFWKAGKLEGEWKQFFEDGSLNLLAFYKNNALEGLATYYFSNGDKKSVGNFSRGLKHGKWTYWLADGEMEKEEEYIQDELIKQTIYNDEVESVDKQK